MKKLFIISIFVIYILFICGTAVPATAGVEPSPFKSKVGVNIIKAAQNQLEAIEPRLERVEEMIDKIPPESYMVPVTRIIDSADKEAINSLRTLERSRDLFEQTDEPDIQDYSEVLEKLHEYDEYLKEDKILGLEGNPAVPESIKELLRHLNNNLQDILNEVEDFQNSLYGINDDNSN